MSKVRTALRLVEDGVALGVRSQSEFFDLFGVRAVVEQERLQRTTENFPLWGEGCVVDCLRGSAGW